MFFVQACACTAHDSTAYDKVAMLAVVWFIIQEIKLMSTADSISSQAISVPLVV